MSYTLAHNYMSSSKSSFIYVKGVFFCDNISYNNRLANYVIKSRFINFSEDLAYAHRSK
jgi:hypothetical protein